MTDRCNAFIVELEEDIREDDAQLVALAIKHIKGVLYVRKNISDLSTQIATDRAKFQLRKQISDMLEIV